ncbi:MAG: glycosyltransferase [Planctomycetota bacterium]
MPLPLVSIITPTYNHQKYIGDCIRSALAQTCQNWEMIIVDDGSTDNTPEIIRGFNDSRIRYIRQAHQGGYKLSSIYNTALREAKGNLVAILEGDDFWPADKLTVQIPYFTDPKIILTYGDCIITNESGHELFYRRIPADTAMRDNSPIGSALNGFIRTENFIYAQTVMVRKDALIKAGGFIQPDYLHLTDFPTWCRLALAGEFKAIPHPLGFWRRNIKSVTMANPVVISEGFIRYINTFIDAYQNQIRRLGININTEEIKKKQSAQLRQSDRDQNYIKALTLFIYGYDKPARQFFGRYLRQPHKGVFNSIVSLLAIIISYTGLSGMILSLTGIHLSGLLVSLKRYLVK